MVNVSLLKGSVKIIQCIYKNNDLLLELDEENYDPPLQASVKYFTARFVE